MRRSDVSDELLACFAEGKCTPEERAAVRAYLMEHPEEVEQLVELMDSDRDIDEEQDADCCLYETSGTEPAPQEDFLADIALSAAAFAPAPPMSCCCAMPPAASPGKASALTGDTGKRSGGIAQRMADLCDELDI